MGQDDELRPNRNTHIGKRFWLATCNVGKRKCAIQLARRILMRADVPQA